MPDGPNLIAINVGNTRTQVGVFLDGELNGAERFLNTAAAPAAEYVLCRWPELSARPSASILLASVNDPAADRLASMIEDQLTIEVYRVGEDVPVPIGRQLDPETITGVDRLLNAAAAFERIGQACVVIDAGTAVTVDFVDGHGTFHGGAIAPGAQMQLRALHDYTDALPEIQFAAPQKEAFGRSTAQAMLQGVCQGIRGMVWRLTEQYATAYGAYPQVVATGGDARALFENDELIDNIVDDLTLLGIAATARHALAGADQDESDLG